MHVPSVFKSVSLNLLKTSGSVQACNGSALPFEDHLGLDIQTTLLDAGFRFLSAVCVVEDSSIRVMLRLINR